MLILTLQSLAPIVLLHGINDHKQTLEPMAEWIRESIPGVYVLNCEVGHGGLDSVLMSFMKQLELLSQCINNDPRTTNGFVAVGHSHGGLLFRAYIQLYNHQRNKALRLITLSSPLGGFFCGNKSTCFNIALPSSINQLIAKLIYSNVIQSNIGPAAYWRDPQQLATYSQKAQILPLLDNIRKVNPLYKQNFISVDQYVLFGSEKDGGMSPWNSAWFGQWGIDDSQMVELEDRIDYEQDSFGLKFMNERGRIERINSGMQHLEYITNEKFVKEQMAPHLIYKK